MSRKDKLAFWAQGRLDHWYFQPASIQKRIAEWFFALFIPTCQHEGCRNKGEACMLLAFGPDEDDTLFWYCYEHKVKEGFCRDCGVFCAGIESFDFGHYKGLCDNCASERQSEEEEMMMEDAQFSYDYDDPNEAIG